MNFFFQSSLPFCVQFFVQFFVHERAFFFQCKKSVAFFFSAGSTGHVVLRSVRVHQAGPICVSVFAADY